MGTTHHNHCKRSMFLLGEKEGTVKVFSEKGEKREAEVEKRTERGRPRFWIEEKTPKPPKSPRGERTSRRRR